MYFVILEHILCILFTSRINIDVPTPPQTVNISRQCMRELGWRPYGARTAFFSEMSILHVFQKYSWSLCWFFRNSKFVNNPSEIAHTLEKTPKKPTYNFLGVARATREWKAVNRGFSSSINKLLNYYAWLVGLRWRRRPWCSYLHVVGSRSLGKLPWLGERGAVHLLDHTMINTLTYRRGR
jgi:hypothetical protein